MNDTNSLTTYLQKQVDFTEEDLQIILPYFKIIETKKKEILLSQGQISKYSYFVNKGCLRIFFINGEEKDITRYIAFENQFATALVSFITKEPAEENIQAIENCELFRISHEDFRQLLLDVPKWKDFYNIYLEKAYVNNLKRLMSFTTLDARERYSQLFRINPNIVRRLPNKIVASYLNISQETLSRVKSKVLK